MIDTEKQFNELYDLTSAIISYELGELDYDATVELFQNLVDSGLAWVLQGSYGRMATDLINSGVISEASSV